MRRHIAVAALLLAAVCGQEDVTAVVSDAAGPQGNGGSQGAVGCKPHCLKDPCTELNGNLTQECGACDSTALCNPSSEGFAAWYEPAALEGLWHGSKGHKNNDPALRGTSRLG